METEGYHPLDQAVQAAMKARAALRAGRLQPDDPRLRLSARQFRGMSALKFGKRPEDVAAELGVPLELVGRWLATPRFRRALQAEREAPMLYALALELARGRPDLVIKEEEEGEPDE